MNVKMLRHKKLSLFQLKNFVFFSFTLRLVSTTEISKVVTCLIHLQITQTNKTTF